MPKTKHDSQTDDKKNKTIFKRTMQYGGLLSIALLKMLYKGTKNVAEDPNKRRFALRTGRLALDFMLFKGKIRRLIMYRILESQIWANARKFIFKHELPPETRQKLEQAQSTS